MRALDLVTEVVEGRVGISKRRAMPYVERMGLDWQQRCLYSYHDFDGHDGAC